MFQKFGILGYPTPLGGGRGEPKNSATGHGRSLNKFSSSSYKRWSVEIAETEKIGALGLTP